MKKRWVGVFGMVLATVAVAEQNPPLPPVPPAGQTGPMRPESRRHDTQVFAMHFGGGDESARILPPGAWWKDTELARRIELTPEQQKRIEDTFLQSKIDLIHLHAGLEEQELLLQPMLNAQPLDQGKVLAQISKIADTRADLEKANAKMLLGIRGVLNQAQWTKLQQERPGGMRHLMIRTPDGPHSWNFAMPELEGMRMQLENMPKIDVAKLRAELATAFAATPAFDAEKLREQMRALQKMRPVAPVGPAVPLEPMVPTAPR